jgi:folate-binding protein YgfZ
VSTLLTDTEALAGDYAAAREAAAFAPLPERGVLEASGPQHLKFLHSLLSNDLAGRSPGQGCLAALMDVKGHLLVLLRALVGKDRVRLELPAERIALVEQTLLHYRVAAPVRFAVRPTLVLGLIGPQARDVLGRTGAVVPELRPEDHAFAELAGCEILVARAGDLPCDGLVLHLSPDAAVAVSSGLVAAGARPLGRPALDALRIEAGRAWYGPDITEQNLLHETGLLREYHSASKGCYVGQEVIARLEARGGNVNKMLRGLRLTSPGAAGQPLTSEGHEVGRVTTAAVSPRLGPIAMAYVRRSHFAAGTSLELEGRPATVSTLPFES